MRRRRIYNIETARDKKRESSERDARTTIFIYLFIQPSLHEEIHIKLNMQ